MIESRERVRDIFEVRVKEDKLGEVLRGLAERMRLLELWIKEKDEKKEGQANVGESCQIKEDWKEFKTKVEKWEDRVNKFQMRIEDLQVWDLRKQVDTLQQRLIMTVEKQELQNVLQELKNGLDGNRLLLQNHIDEQQRYNMVVEDRVAKVEVLCQSGLNALHSLTRDFQNMQVSHSPTKINPKKSRISARKSIAELLNERSAQPHTNNNHNTTIEYASLSIKIQALQKAISDLSIRPMQPTYSKFQQQFANRRTSCMQGESMSSIKSHLDMYIVSSSQQVSRLSNNVKEIRFKHEILQQSIEAVMRKVSKLNNLQAVLQTRLIDLEKIRVDSQTINEITLRFRQIQSSLQQQQKPKFPTLEIYNADLKKLNEQIVNINATLIKTAREEDTKTAFHFIEAKIRELITVVASKFEEEKQGAINRTQLLRCLTCDREADLPALRNQVQPHLLCAKNCHQQASVLKRNPRKTWIRIKTQQ